MENDAFDWLARECGLLDQRVELPTGQTERYLYGIRTVAAWGGGGTLRHRSTVVRPLLRAPYCLGTTKAGEPRHPLYVHLDTEAVLLPWGLNGTRQAVPAA